MTHTTHTTSFLIRLMALAGGMAIASTLPAQTPSSFPLEVGNTWLYRSAAASRPGSYNPENRTISVHGKEKAGGREYFAVSYFGREVLLRSEAADDSVLVYDRVSGTEKTWLALGLPVGSTFSTEINPCPTTGEIVSRKADITTPAGSFTNAIQVRYRGNCADVGATNQHYVPGVGLAVHEETTIAGPIVYELLYYRVGATTGSGTETSFTVATDSPKYVTGGTLQARLTLRSTSPEPISLHYTSGQSFDLRIRNEKGDTVYFWGAGVLFIMMIRDEKFGPGEKTYGVSVNLTGLAPGRYTVEGYLTTDPVVYTGQTAIEVVPGAVIARNSLPGVVKETRSHVILQ